VRHGSQHVTQTSEPWVRCVSVDCPEDPRAGPRKGGREGGWPSVSATSRSVLAARCSHILTSAVPLPMLDIVAR